MKTNKHIGFLLFLICAALIAFLVFNYSKPKLSETPFKESIHLLQKDSTLMEDGRQYGDINLDKFIELASRKPRSVFNPATDVVRSGDSVTFSSNSPAIFFGVDNGAWWKKKYKELPISFPDERSFRAVVHTKDSVEYILIPYEILSCLAGSFNENPQPVNGNKQAYVNDSTITITSKDFESLRHDGSLIQTGGIVFQHVAEVLQENGGQNKTSREQLEILWRHAYRNWLYVHDPYAGTDTWRSASETIEAYYFAEKKGYTGDCDDFAILMASFARQVGFESHIVLAVNQNGGHAYAEFNDNGTWVPMDWFSSRFGGRAFQGTIQKVVDDI